MPRIKITTILLFTFLGLIYSQNNLESGFPLVNNYSPKEYGADTQNWAILQDDRGVMYFGNNLGLLEFDGADWKLYPMPNNATCRSLANGEDGKIYAGGVGDLGYYYPDSLGQLTFNSLYKFVPEEQRDFSDVWTTVMVDDKVFFNTASYILIWDSKTKNFDVLQGDDNFHLMDEVNGKIYVREWGKGLQVLEGDSLIMLNGGEKFANERVYVTLPFPDEDGTVLFVTRTMGMFKYDGNNFIPFKTEVDDFIKKNLIYLPGAILYDGNILLGTLNDGAVVIDRYGKLVKKYNRVSGIISTVIYYTFQDRSGAIWLPTDNGISRIDYASQVSYFDSRNNFSTSAYQLIRHNNILYAATNNGVYYLDSKTSMFYKLKGSNNQSFAFMESGADLIVGANDGLFKVDKYQIVPIRKTIGNEYGVNSITQSKLDPNRFYIGAAGLWSIYKNARGWLDEGQILDMTDPVNSIEEENNGTLWLGTNASGTFKVTLKKDERGKVTLEKPLFEKFDISNGLPSGVIYVKKLNGENYFLSAENFYKYDEEKNSFYLDNTYKVVPSFANSINPNNIREDNLRRLWISLGREPALGTPQPNGTYQWLTAPFKRFSNEIILSIYPEDNGKVWFSSSSSIIKYDLTQSNFYNSDYSVLIRKVDIGSDSTIYYGGELAKPTIPEIGFQNNSLKFTFAAPSYEDETANQYKSYLEGFDDKWSAWANENKKEYTNLSPGEYTFKVIAKNVFEIESKEAHYSFLILAPWYRTWIAYFLYAIVLALGLFLVDRFQRRRLLNKAKERMKIQEVEHRAETAELHAKAAEAQSKIIQAENDRKTTELEEARELQLSMLPTELPVIENLEVAAYMNTATEVGGDYYDFDILNEGVLNVAIGDGTGHGMQAGTLVTLIKGLFTSEVRNKEILEFFKDTNQTIRKINFGRLMMAFSLLRLKGNSLQFSSAGMPPMYIYRSNSKEVEEINLKGMPLGAIKNFDYQLHETELNPGDCMLLLSDGYPELLNVDNEQIGYDRVKSQFLSIANRRPTEIIDYFKNWGSEWANDKEPDDDVTFVVIKVK
jgi:serine phosphatase RsbU (regulator of sigma subunit)